MLMRVFLFLLFCIWAPAVVLYSQQQSAYVMEQGQVNFISDAPLESIKASSSGLRGVLDIEKGTFAFSLSINTFSGFNSPLQQVHFYENYLEVDKFPTATFSGKVIEKIALSHGHQFTIRAKGNLTIHGVKKERIIKVNLFVGEGKIQITSDFTIFLEEHDIAIPRIVYQKIAEEIKVNLAGEMKTLPQ